MKVVFIIIAVIKNCVFFGKSFSELSLLWHPDNWHWPNNSGPKEDTEKLKKKENNKEKIKIKKLKSKMPKEKEFSHKA